MNLIDEQRKRLKYIRSLLGYSQAQFALKLPYSLSSVSAIEAGNQKMPITFAYKLQDSIVSDKNNNVRIISQDAPKREDEFYLRAEWLFRGTGTAFDFGRISDFARNLNIEIFNQKGSVNLPLTDNIIFYQITDDTMADFLLQRDIIAIDINERNIISGQIYLVKVFDEYMPRKVFNFDSETINLVSFNNELVPTITVKKSDAEIIGRFKYLIRSNNC